MIIAIIKNKQNIKGSQSKDLLPVLGKGEHLNERRTKSSAGRGHEGVRRAGCGRHPKARTAHVNPQKHDAA